MAQSYSYDYPRPAVTADVAVLRLDVEPEVLLVKRRDEPYRDMWALPGGFMEMEETLEETARRELMEECGIHAGELIRIDTYDKPGRDPRGRTITQVFVTIWKKESGIPKAGSDAKSLLWYSLADLPQLAFDHSEILRDVISLIREAK